MSEQADGPIRHDWLPDLTGRGRVKYLALLFALSEAIEQGDLRPGDRLPPQRELAWKLGLNLSTVTQAWKEATKAHLISGEVGRGTYILGHSREAALFALHPGTRRSTAIRDVRDDEPDREQERDALIDLSTNTPALPQTVEDLMVSMTNVLQEKGAEWLAYADEAALLSTCLSVAGFMARRGFPCLPEQIYLCPGAQHALSVVLSAFCQTGDSVLVEAYTFPGMKALARQFGLHLVPVALDEEGICPDDLARAARASGARLLVMIPTMQNPTGGTQSRERRQAILKQAGQLGLTIVEEDVYGPLVDQAPMAAMAEAQHLPIILIGSLSKSVAPGLRLGYIIGDLPKDMTSVWHHATSWGMAPIMLALAARWLDGGLAEKAINWQKQEMATRWRMARKALGRAYGWQAERHTPTPHIWLPVPDADQLAEHARKRAVLVVPSRVFAVGRGQESAVRLSLTRPSTQRCLAIALDRLLACHRQTGG